MSLNSATVTPQTRQPTFKVQVGGNPCPGFNSFEVTNNSHFTADTFRLEAPLAALPSTFGAAYWMSTTNQTLEIFADDTGQGNFVSLIYGQVDDIEVDLTGRKLSLSGRDLSAQFMDAKTTERWEENTSSQIVGILAARHGLTANVQSTSTKVGRYYEQEHARITQEESEWEILTYLAQEEGFDLWVSGQTLNFQPAAPLNSTPYILQWSDGGNVANFVRLRMSRSLTLAKDVIVKVSTWNQAQETAIVHQCKVSQAARSQSSAGAPQIYSFTLPNMEASKALQWAQNKAEEITQHERVLMVELPADNVLNIRSIVQLLGTNTSADQTYRVSSIEREMSFERGYVMTARLKNHSPQSTVLG